MYSVLYYDKEREEEGVVYSGLSKHDAYHAAKSLERITPNCIAYVVEEVEV